MFWNAASKGFAQRASGTVYIMLNGTRNAGAIANWSTFINYELPEFKKERIKQVTVLLLHSPDQPKFETCNEPKTLVYLQNVLKEREIQYECLDNPSNMAYLMCFYQPGSKDCQSVQFLTKKANTDNSTSAVKTPPANTQGTQKFLFGKRAIG
jgi:hypothetical protein